MAIYHFHAGAISRKAGKSAVAASAYRGGQRLFDERTERVWDYSMKVVTYSQLMSLDDSLDTIPGELWNAVEAMERRKDSTTAKEWEISLPHELDLPQRIACAQSLARLVMQFDRTCCEMAIHPPSKASPLNWHVHIQTPCREFSGGQFGQRCLSTVKADERKRRGVTTSRFQDFMALREMVAGVLNEYLELAGVEERVDHRSFKDRGLDLEPTIHEGAGATARSRRGEQTRVRAINDAIRERNRQRLAQREQEQEDSGMVPTV